VSCSAGEGGVIGGVAPAGSGADEVSGTVMVSELAVP
jgi:hypothetical protein